jgi:hypothetical protein
VKGGQAARSGHVTRGGTEGEGGPLPVANAWARRRRPPVGESGERVARERVGRPGKNVGVGPGLRETVEFFYLVEIISKGSDLFRLKDGLPGF